MNKIKVIGYLGVGGQKGVVYQTDGISPCETATQYTDATKVLEITAIGSKGNNMADMNVIGTMEEVFESRNRVYGTDGICPTIDSCSGGNRQPKIVEVIGGIGEQKSNGGKQYYQQDRVYNPECLCPSLNASGDQLVPNTITVNKTNDANCMTIDNKITPLNPMPDGVCRTLKNQYGKNSVDNFESQGTFEASGVLHIRQATKEGFIPCEIGGVADLNYPESKTRRGRVQGNGQICPTLTTENIPSVLEEWTWEIDGELYLIRIRKLTPRECWRLMDFKDEDFEKAEQVCSNTQLYKQAGNSIVRNCLVEIFRNLL